MKLPSINFVGLFPKAGDDRPRPQLFDLVVFASFILLFWIIGSLGRDMSVPISGSGHIDLDFKNLPYYTARSTLRMFIAYGFSLAFTLVTGYLAAHSMRARSLILPAIDVLQSVPVLGFLSATVTGFMSLFPGSLMGVELASIFAVFTGQVWNMTFGFYHSLVTVPHDLEEASTAFGLNAWKRFKTVELPSGAISLIWNSMMSFGGGWFFVVQSEAISVLNQKITLPGLGSYMAMAAEKGNSRAAWMAVLCMVITVVAIDQLVWRPIVAWSQKYRVEQVESANSQTSWALAMGRRSWLLRHAANAFKKTFVRALDSIMDVTVEKTENRMTRNPFWKVVWDRVSVFIFFAILALIAYESLRIVREIKTNLSADQIVRIFKIAFYTMIRVFVMVIIATLIWTPIGVWIGFRPRIARFAQPLAQIAASFPVNMTFPFVIGFFVARNISINIGSVLLLALGTQWYILFNVIAGASSVPADLKECGSVFGLKGRSYWRKLIIPAIFPYWVTGACTAAGGAWNASIVAEYAAWGNQRLVADGLGAFIAQVTEKGDWPAIFCSIAVMSIFVVTLNKILWRNLYGLAERKFRLE